MSTRKDYLWSKVPTCQLIYCKSIQRRIQDTANAEDGAISALLRTFIS